MQDLHSGPVWNRVGGDAGVVPVVIRRHFLHLKRLKEFGFEGVMSQLAVWSAVNNQSLLIAYYK